MRRIWRAGVVFVCVCIGAAASDIINWQTGQVIPGTREVDLQPGVWLEHRADDGINLDFADLSNSDLRWSSFGWSRLDGALFTNSDLRHSNFTSAKVQNADFSGALISGADFSGSTFNGVQLYSTRSYQEKDLRGIGLNGKNLSGGDFSGQNLSGSSFFEANVSNTSFAEADLSGAGFQHAVLGTANFTNSRVNNANFFGTQLSRDQLFSTQSWQDKNLSGLTLPEYFNLSYTNLSSFNLTGMDFSVINIANADITGSIINGSSFSMRTNYPVSKQQLFSTQSWQQKDLSGVRITGGDFAGIDFSGFDLTNAGLLRMYLAGADFTDAVITGCDFSGATSFTGLQFYSTKSYKDKDVRGIILNDLNLSNANFRDLNMQGASFDGATLYGTDLTGADLRGCSFVGGLLNAAVFTDADIRGAIFDTADDIRWWQGSSILPQLYSTRSYKEKDLRGITFVQSGLLGTAIEQYDLTEQNLTDASFAGCRMSLTLRRAILTNTDFTNTTFGAGSDLGDTTSRGFTKEQFYSTASYRLGRMTGINLSQNDLHEWVFAGKYLSSVDFSFCNLQNAQLNSASLRNVVFSYADLTGANFGESLLAGSVFENAIIRYADFHQTDFNGAQCYATQSYKEKDLRGVNLSGCNLGGADFSGQNLTGASLAHAICTNMDLTDAIVTGADFSGTTGRGLSGVQFYTTQSYKDKNLRGVKLCQNNLGGALFARMDFTGADFTGANLTNADFTGAKLEYADFSKTTGFIGVQLYSTESYQNRTLRGIGLGYLNLTGADFSGIDLTGASFLGATIKNVNFTDALVTWVDFRSVREADREQLRSTASFKNRTLEGVNLAGALMTPFDLSGFNLSFADLSRTGLEGVSLANAVVNGTSFSATTAKGVNREQLYSTHNWQVKDLSGIRLDENDLTNWDFSGQNLQRASFASSTLTGASFEGADVRFTDFSSSTLTGPQLYSTKSYQQRDLRGIGLANRNLSYAYFYGQSMIGADLSGSHLQLADFSLTDLRQAKGFAAAETTHLRSAILPDGTVDGLMLYAGEVLNIHNCSTAIRVNGSFVMQTESALRFYLSDNWQSVVAVQPGILPELGVLDLQFEEGTDVESLIGTSFKLFEWNGTLASGQQFADIMTQGNFAWDFSELYTTGEITLIPEPATFALLTLGWLIGSRHSGKKGRA